MALQDQLRAAIGPVVSSIIGMFPSTVTITRTRTTLGAGNRPTEDDVPLANGKDITALVTASTREGDRRIFGRDVTMDAIGLVRDSVDVQPDDKVSVLEGPHAGEVFYVKKTEPSYLGSLRALALTRERPHAGS